MQQNLPVISKYQIREVSLKQQHQLKNFDRQREPVVWNPIESVEEIELSKSKNFQNFPSFTTLIYEPNEETRQCFVEICERLNLNVSFADCADDLIKKVKGTLQN